MTDIHTIKRRRLQTSLKSLLEANLALDKSNPKLPKLDARHECYAVIRSKGGSGEIHATKKLIEDLQARNKHILVCYENKIDKNHYYTKYLPNGSNSFLKTTLLLSASKTGLLNCDWTNPHNLFDLIHSLNSSPGDYSVIFSCGTSSGGKFVERLSPISKLCKTIFITVNSEVDNSILPTQQLSNELDLDLKKIKAIWWYSDKAQIDSNEPKAHKFAIFSLDDLKAFSTEELNKKAEIFNSLVN